MPLFSHYGDLPDSSAALTIPSLVFAIVTPIIVVLRLGSRHYLSGRTGPDDWTIVMSCVCSRSLRFVVEANTCSLQVFAETVNIQMIIGSPVSAAVKRFC